VESAKSAIFVASYGGCPSCLLADQITSYGPGEAGKITDFTDFEDRTDGGSTTAQEADG
jgi:hypothetical protein